MTPDAVWSVVGQLVGAAGVLAVILLALGIMRRI